LRLFAFGCSFTKYYWPTWADILGRDYAFENWGCPGAGNQYIFNALIECHLRNKLTKDDTVCIMWSNVSREDRYVNNAWLTPGNIYNQTMYDADFIEKFADTRGYYLRDLALIYATDQLLKSIGCKYHYMSMVDIKNPLSDGHQPAGDSSEEIADFIEYYQPVLSKFKPSVHRVIFNLEWTSRTNTVGTHGIDLKEIILERKRWAQWYRDIKDPDWPACDKEQYFSSLPEHVQKECIETFGYQPRTEKSMLEKWKLSAKQLQMVLSKPTARKDAHPTPLEHLEYVQTVLPEFNISESTQQWVKQIDDMLQNSQDYSEHWLPGDINRW
jgi:hypothetical protein